METAALISRISAVAPGAYLHKNRFGRSDQLSIWVDLRKIREIAAALRGDTAKGLAWLENMSVAQVDESLVVTYFIRNSILDAKKEKGDAVVVLRGSVALESGSSADSRVDVPSVATIWQNVVPMEREFAELFGIRFLDSEGKEANPEAFPFLPEKWNGFPLRKDYVFPREVFGIDHSRATPVKEPVKAYYDEVKKNVQ